MTYSRRRDVSFLRHFAQKGECPTLRPHRQWPILQASSDLDPDPDRLSEYEMRQFSRDEVFGYGSYDNYVAVQRRVANSLLGAGEFDDEPRSDAYNELHLVGLISETPPPEILNVCKESLGVVTKSYAPYFRCLGSVAETWFNFEIDTLYLRYDTFEALYPTDEDGPYGGLVDEDLQNAIESGDLIGLDNEYLQNAMEGGARILDRKKMRLVKKLAILLDPVHETPLPLNPVLAIVLRSFGHLEELCLVLRHFQLHEPEDTQRDLAFTDMVDYRKTLRAYE